MKILNNISFKLSRYRQSLNCQAEAQYSFKLNKKIIPLIMQDSYENVKVNKILMLIQGEIMTEYLKENRITY
jgi:hypothetical protein